MKGPTARLYPAKRERELRTLDRLLIPHRNRNEFHDHNYMAISRLLTEVLNHEASADFTHPRINICLFLIAVLGHNNLIIVMGGILLGTRCTTIWQGKQHLLYCLLFLDYYIR